MKRVKGSFLVATMGFIVVFTMFGVSSIYLAGLQNQAVDKNIASSQAFWLAEAGINWALAHYSFTGPSEQPFSSSSGEFSDSRWAYNSIVRPIPSTNHYQVCAIGSVNNIRRKIEVEAIQTNSSIDDVITCADDLNTRVTGDTEINGTTREFVDFTGLFEETFKMTKDELRSLAQIVGFDNNPDDDPDDGVLGVSGITWINIPAGSTLMISSSNWSGSGFLFLSQEPGPESATLKITGGTFSGIIWVDGDLRIDGNPPINGSIFVEGIATVNTIGTANISYDLDAINAALGLLPGGANTTFKLTPLSWDETYTYGSL